MWARSFATILLVLLLTPHSSSARRTRRASQSSVLSSAPADLELEKLKELVESVKTDKVLLEQALELKEVPLSTPYPETLMGSQLDVEADGKVALHISEILETRVEKLRGVLKEAGKNKYPVADLDKMELQLKNADIVVNHVEWVKVLHFEVQLASKGDEKSPRFYATNFIADLTVNGKAKVWFKTFHKSIRIGVKLTDAAHKAAASSELHKEFIPEDFELNLSGIFKADVLVPPLKKKIMQKVVDLCNAMSLPAAEAEGQLSHAKAVKIQVQTEEGNKIAIYAAAKFDKDAEKFTALTGEQAGALKKKAFKELSSLVEKIIDVVMS